MNQTIYKLKLSFLISVIFKITNREEICFDLIAPIHQEDIFGLDKGRLSSSSSLCDSVHLWWQDKVSSLIMEQLICFFLWKYNDILVSAVRD